MKKINIYIAKTFLARFLQILLGFSILIFFINLLSVSEEVKSSGASFYIGLQISFLKMPEFINDVTPSLVLISGIITFFLLSSKSEITIIRSSGFSLWQIVQPIALSAFFLGIFWITIIDPIFVKMMNKFHAMESVYINNEESDVFEPNGGVWIKQSNMEKKDEEIIIQATRVYRDNLELSEATIWFIDKNGKFYQKMDVDSMFLEGKSWLLQDLIINNSSDLNKSVKLHSIPTNLKADFIMQKIINNFQNEKLFSIYQLPFLVKDLELSGFSSTKFKAHLHSLLSKPLLFLAMILIACYFGLNHIRSRSAVLMMFLGTITGLALYIISQIVIALGSSAIIPVFASTWVVAIICLAVGILTIYQKEKF